jgi:N-acetylmuramoyl-L-alanine amidase
MGRSVACSGLKSATVIVALAAGTSAPAAWARDGFFPPFDSAGGPTIVEVTVTPGTARIVFDESAVGLDDEQADAVARALHAEGSVFAAYPRQELYVRRADGSVVPWADLQRIPVDDRAAIDEAREDNLRPLRGSPPPVGGHAPEGALVGRRIVISPGHGFVYVDTLGIWSTQRGDSNGIIEDISNNEIASYYLIPYLERAGAQVFSARERGITEWEVVIDNDGGAGYAEEGAWSDGAATGYGGTYRFANADAAGSSVAHFRFTVPESDTWPVYARWIAGANRSGAATFEVVHAGGTTPIVVNQQAEDARWLYLGGFVFRAGTEYEVRLSSRGGDASQVVVADAVRVGGGMGDVLDGGMISGQARWREAAWAWVHTVGSTVPAAVLAGNDVTIRPLYADWEGADAFLSLHSNAGGGRGTESYIHDTAPSAGSAELMDAVQTDIVHAIRALWDPAWNDRGQKTANFGELRECRSMPAALVETAFHDDVTDAALLIHPRFRHDIGRALAYGIQEYLAPGTPPPPLPPVHLRVRALDGRRARVQWQPAVDVAWPAAVPARYRVYRSADGYGFDDMNPVETTDTSIELDDLPWGETTYLRLTAVNAGGESFPTEVLGVRPLDPPTRILVVNGFDRLDRYVRERDNTFDFIVQHGEAVAAAGDGRYGFDSTSNEAVAAGEVELGGYATVLWILGEESTQDDSFSGPERDAIDAFLASGGNLCVTESEMGWDLVQLGTAEETAWVEATFHATFVAADAETYAADAVAGGLFAGLGTIAFDDGTHGTYDSNYPDVWAATAPATVALSYAGGTGGGAAVVFDGAQRTVLLGFGFEGIYDATMRRDVMTRILGFLAPDVPEPVEPVDGGDGGDGGADGDADAAADADADTADGADDGTSDADGAADGASGSDGAGCSCRATGESRESGLGACLLAAIALVFSSRPRSRRCRAARPGDGRRSPPRE